jgi:hypothetical protein
MLASAASSPAQSANAVASVKEMSQRLRAAGAPEQRAELAASLRDTVRAYVESELNTGKGASLASRSEALEAQLSEAQIGSQTWDDAVGAPFVRSKEGPAGATVFASFVALEGGAGSPQSNTWIWALRDRNGKFEAVDSTGSDFAGCGLFLQEIPSGRSGETWLLAWGPVFGANQSPVRMRVYAFDGEKFETIWSPPDRFQGKVRVQDGVLEVSYLDAVQHYERREAPFFRSDRYALSVQGLVETQSVLTELPAIP